MLTFEGIVTKSFGMASHCSLVPVKQIVVKLPHCLYLI